MFASAKEEPAEGKPLQRAGTRVKEYCQDADRKKLAAQLLVGFLAVEGARRLLRFARRGITGHSDLIILKGSGGFECHLLRDGTGASIYRIITPDRNGDLDDVVLGHRSIADYQVDKRNTYFGCIVGRVANRVQNAEFPHPSSEGVVKLEANDKPHALHGGSRHWGRRQWRAREFTHARGPAVVYELTSPDGDAGYPGEVQASVTYIVDEGNDRRNTLVIVMEAQTLATTPVSLVQHSYFNLAGHKQVEQGALVLDHTMEINSSCITHTRDDLIPTGEFASVQGTAFDFTNPSFIGERMTANSGGFDTNFVLHAASAPALRAMCTQPAGMMARTQKAAEVFEPKSGRGLEVETNAPGLQFYTGNFLDGRNKGKNGALYNKHAGFCVETQALPNAVNTPQFPSPLLRPEERYRHEMILKFFAN